MPLEEFLKLMGIIKQNLDNRDLVLKSKDSRILELESENITLRERLANSQAALSTALANDAADAETIQAAKDASAAAIDELFVAKRQLAISQDELVASVEKTRVEKEQLLTAIADAQTQFSS
jgi:hypothetical protein